MRQLSGTFPGLCVFIPSNSVKSHHSSKYAASERPGYAKSEQPPVTAGAEGGSATDGRLLVGGVVLRHDVGRDAAALVHLEPTRLGPLADSRALLAPRA